MLKNKPVIVEFKPDIYPYRFWLVINKDFNVVSKNFKYANNREINDLDDLNYNALTLTVRDAAGYYGSVIYFPNCDEMLSKIVAHECFHAVANLFDHIGETNTGEPFAYMLEWLFQKCEDTKNEHQDGNK